MVGNDDITVGTRLQVITISDEYIRNRKKHHFSMPSLIKMNENGN